MNPGTLTASANVWFTTCKTKRYYCNLVFCILVFTRIVYNHKVMPGSSMLTGKVPTVTVSVEKKPVILDIYIGATE